MPSEQTKFLNSIQSVIDDEISLYKQDRSITEWNHIPSTTSIPIENKQNWIKIQGVICVYVDMIGSTLLSAEKQPKTCAKLYHLFSDTITRIFHEFDAQYIDIQGDGVFALFNSDQLYRSLASAVTVKTFIETYFEPEVKSMRRFGAQIGIDQGTLLVRKIGLKFKDRSDRQNELWAGKPVNMAVKLSAKAARGEMIVSDRYFNKLANDLVLKSCGCKGDSHYGSKENLWTETDVSDDDRLDFNKAYLLKSIWCSLHGQSYCSAIVALDR